MLHARTFGSLVIAIGRIAQASGDTPNAFRPLRLTPLETSCRTRSMSLRVIAVTRSSVAYREAWKRCCRKTPKAMAAPVTAMLLASSTLLRFMPPLSWLRFSFAQCVARGTFTGNEASGEGGLQVIAAHRPGNVENLAAKVESALF